MCTYIYIYIYIYTHTLSAYKYIYLHKHTHRHTVYIYIFMYLFIYAFIYLFILRFRFRFIYWFTYLFICLCVCVCVCACVEHIAFISSTINQFIALSMCKYIYMYIHICIIRYLYPQVPHFSKQIGVERCDRPTSSPHSQVPAQIPASRSPVLAGKGCSSHLRFPGLRSLAMGNLYISTWFMVIMFHRKTLEKDLLVGETSEAIA